MNTRAREEYENGRMRQEECRESVFRFENWIFFSLGRDACTPELRWLRVQSRRRSASEGADRGVVVASWFISEAAADLGDKSFLDGVTSGLRGP